MPAKILQCVCKNKFMDEKYGEGKRVFAQTMANDKKMYRCCACRAEKSTGGDDKKK